MSPFIGKKLSLNLKLNHQVKKRIRTLGFIRARIRKYDATHEQIRTQIRLMS
jgi:hypothetical protein